MYEYLWQCHFSLVFWSNKDCKPEPSDEDIFSEWIYPTLASI